MTRSLAHYTTRPFNHLALVAALGAALISSQAMAEPRESSRFIDVQATAEVDVAPDEAVLSARLWELTPATPQESDQGHQGDELAETRGRLEDRAAKLVEALEAAGLSSDNINAGSLHVQQEVLHRPQGNDEAPVPMVRTRLERPISLSISDLSSVPTILDALTKAGVNSLDGITYGLEDQSAADDQALTRALERARAKAELMAGSLGVELGDVISINEVADQGYQPRMMAMRAEVADSSGGAEYRPGNITIDAGVNVRWEIEAPTADDGE
ncbi:SIMPL domain-containing protein [Halomonas huangheensis]|uniref:SIMPL domain-containing protein n=1 Tax=Halomonas huangheensis TaxID=1178482 RepID=W1N598_9GAMM|nr:SIMPL domain-containing protein [Halomonas huangheensis]ALM51803.1 hypothetical protein AR456_05500 [Halomonas huangheensis]ERL50316.1 hypothetical protein BJB45_04065 [Halomonas huangheensis]